MLVVNCALCGARVRSTRPSSSASFQGAGVPEDATLQRLFGLRARNRASARLHNEVVTLTLDDGSARQGNCYRMCLEAHQQDSTRRGTRDNPSTSYITARARAARQSEPIKLEVCVLNAPTWVHRII